MGAFFKTLALARLSEDFRLERRASAGVCPLQRSSKVQENTSFQRSVAAFLSAAAILGSATHADAQTAWLAPVNGTWTTGANWTAGAPSGGVATSITATGAPYTVSQSGGNIFAASLLMDSPDATLSLSSGARLNNNLTIPIALTRGNVRLNAGQIVGSSIIGSAFTVLSTGGISVLYLDRNDGLIRATSGKLVLDGGSVSSSWDIGPTGRIEADGATTELAISGNAGGWTNAGQIIARNGGQISVGNTATARLGNLQIFDTARIYLGVIDNTGASIVPPTGGPFDGGNSRVTGGTIPAGTVLLRARTNAGVVGLDLKGATWEGDVNIVDNAINFYAGSTFTGANLTALRGFGVSYLHTTTISGKTFTLTSDPLATTPVAFTIASEFNEANTVTLAADTVLRGTGFKLDGALNATLINQGLIESLAGNSTSGGLGTLQNDGRIRATAGTFGVQAGALINNGIVEARAGTTLIFSGGLTFTQSATGEMRGAGKFALNNPIAGGILRPGDDGIGTMTVQSPFGQPATFTGPTTFAIELGGAASDQIIFNNGSQNTELGTTMVSLALTLTAAPTAQTYRIVNLPAGFQNLLSGNFVGLPNGATIAASFAGTSYNFSVQYDTKGVSLVPIAPSVPSYSVSPIGPLTFSTFTGVPSAPQTITITSTGTSAV
ncbi:MAG: hypothetical protein ABL931_16535, partial [Usitatibacteraceae bacterium]